MNVLDNIITSEFKAKVEPRLGPGARSVGALLRRTLPWRTMGVFIKKHFENLAGALGLLGIKPATSPVSRSTGRGQRDMLDVLSKQEAT